jgi:hypothetical protein
MAGDDGKQCRHQSILSLAGLPGYQSARQSWLDDGHSPQPGATTRGTLTRVGFERLDPHLARDPIAHSDPYHRRVSPRECRDHWADTEPEWSHGGSWLTTFVLPPKVVGDAVASAVPLSARLTVARAVDAYDKAERPHRSAALGSAVLLARCWRLPNVDSIQVGASPGDVLGRPE